MQVTQYLFQSPYSSPVQFGRVDPSTQNSEKGNEKLLASTNEAVQKAQNFQATQTQEVKPKVDSNSLLDVYA